MVGLEGFLALQIGLPGVGTIALLLVIAGLLLSIAEALIPGAHFIVLGVALLAAGLVGLLLGPLGVPPLIGIVILGILVLVFGGISLHAYRELDVWGTEVDRTRDSTSLRGQTGRVTQRVTSTEGQIRLDEGGFNPHYAARSFEDEIAEGTEVIVVDPGGGSVVTVTSVDGEDEIDRELAAERERQRRRTEEHRRAEDQKAEEHATDDQTTKTDDPGSTSTSTSEPDTEQDREMDREPSR